MPGAVGGDPSGQRSYFVSVESNVNGRLWQSESLPPANNTLCSGSTDPLCPMPFRIFNLGNNLYQAVEEAGYTEPTPIQLEAIPKIMAGHDLIGIAHTGTGKTAAFVLPILSQLFKAGGSSQPAEYVG